MTTKLDQAYQHCLHIAGQHYENFPTASLLIRRDLRPAVAAIYAFARHADDLADEGDATPEVRLKQLDAWEVLLERSQQEQGVDHPVFLALADVIHCHQLPVHLLHDLMTAFRMDITIHAYSSVQELMFYCKHSANPVGRLVLALHGINQPLAMQASDAICTALQLVNFWQDLSVDIPRGRCYLPDEWLNFSDLNSATVLSEACTDSMDEALHQALDYTESLFIQGRALLPYLPLRLKLQIVATLRGGMAILHAVRQSSDPLHTRPALSRRQWCSMVLPIVYDTLMPHPRSATA